MSNNTTNTTIQIPSPSGSTGVTDTELWVQLIIFFGLLGGLVPLIGYTALAIGIRKTKTLRTRFHAILSYLSVCRALFSAQNLLVSLHRSLRTAQVVDTNTTSGTCYVIHFTFYYATTLDQVLLLGLLIDRVIAIVGYKYYRTLTYNQAVISCAIAVVITIPLKIVPSVLFVDFGSYIPCINFFSPLTPSFIAYHQYTDMLLALVIVLIYIGLIVYLRFRFFPQMASTKQYAEQAPMRLFNRQKALLAILRHLVYIHCGMSLMNRLLLWASGFMPVTVARRLVAYSAPMECLDLFSFMILVLRKNDDLRKATFPYCMKGKTAVVQVTHQRTIDVKQRSGASTKQQEG